MIDNQPKEEEQKKAPSREEKNADKTKKKNKSLFLTTSTIMDTMNSILAQDETLKASCNSEQEPPHFELQRRLPDGRTRRANDEELAACNFESKISQAAAETANLTPEKKIEWSRRLRIEANNLFHEEEYREAMDSYLVCLVGMNGLFDNDNKNKTKDNNKEHSDSLTSSLPSEEDLEKEIQLPVFINLSICAMKLRMYKKSIQFCNFAADLNVGKCSPKVYFLRGKARMLLGEDYHAARHDLEHSLSILEDKGSDEERKAVMKEMNKLAHLEKTARINKNKCRKAMKVILGGDASKKHPTEVGEEITKNNVNDDTASTQMTKTSSSSTQPSLYHDVRQRKTHSSLRKRKVTPTTVKPTSKSNDRNIMYRHIIVAILQILVTMVFCSILFLSIKNTFFTES